ncbi:GGDEF domain-containing response regulator [Bermanella marisrubri]|uniref:Predicted signal transduction protein containing a membrane domain, an EAL and a GGDEF domain n=1 Tax=Bermanella marisrubri TaxID=207949 RepID=Q1N0I7_9GAMM|nr:GGDEF domain-containing response regulator [Bermanella marisrubri]EAT11677.1 predicted signal transduction protein containing a membrane domain, an EAL and a GGDEF domain [Oceanobacter sp. RED65] [Bermanella marisrubri]QIZ83287.1 GGDEF domain-containing response regulator [Bermanella marisrubri]
MSDEYRILMVEDDSDDYYLTKQALAKDHHRRYDIDRAKSIRAASDYVSNRYDTILLDVVLPDSEGVNSILEIQNAFPNTPIIVLTGMGNDELGQSAIQLGVADYLSKSDMTPGLLSRCIRFSIERHNLINKLQNMALIDPLTLLSNRADFMQKLEHHLEYSLRYQTKLALCMVDLDGFKQVNDTLGHRAGDQVLQQFSTRLKQRLRKSDVLARLGGDEFVILMLGVGDEESSMQAAKEKMQAVAEPFLIYMDGQVHDIQLGMSIGICISGGTISTPDKLLHCADQAMYQVKKSGKNNIALHKSPPESA